MKNRRTRRQRIREKQEKLRKGRKGAPVFVLVDQNGQRVARRPEHPEPEVPAPRPKKARYQLPGD